MSEYTLWIVPSGQLTSVYGGGQVQVLDLVREAIRRNVNVTVLQPVNNGDVGFTAKHVSGIHVVNFPLGPEGVINPSSLVRLLSSNGWGSQAALPVGAPHMQMPAVVYANGWKSAIARACAAAGVPCVVTMRHGGLVCPNGALLDWEDRVCLRPVADEPCISCCRKAIRAGNVVDAVARLFPPGLLRRLDRQLPPKPNIPFVSPALRCSSAPRRTREAMDALKLPGTIMVAPSRASREALLRNGFPPEQVVLLPHGIVPLERQPLAPGLGSRPLRLVYVGRINRVKGLHILIEALRRLPEDAAWELHIAGRAVTSSEQRYHRALLGAKLDWSKVRWCGHLDRLGLARLMANCDVLVLPTICHENFGLVIPEAFSVGRPVIATRSGGPEDLVHHESDGLLVNPNDSKELAEAIFSLIRDPQKLVAMASRIGRVRTVQEQFLDLEKVYQTAIRLRPLPYRAPLSSC